MSDFRAALGEEYRLFTGRKKRVGDYRGRLQGGKKRAGDYRGRLQGGEERGRLQK